MTTTKNTYSTENLETLTSEKLKTLAKTMKVKNWWNLKKADLITAIQEAEKASTPAPKETPKPETKKVPMPGADKLGDLKKAKEDKALKAKKAEKNEANLITLKELASEFNMKGTKARRILRNISAARPYGGNRWEWDKNLHKAELEAAREALKKSTK